MSTIEMVRGSAMNILSAKEAAKTAVEMLIELIPDAKYASLEGIELSNDERYWNVIVGYVRSEDIPATTGLATLASTRKTRTYKLIVLDKKTLELIKLEPYREKSYE